MEPIIYIVAGIGITIFIYCVWQFAFSRFKELIQREVSEQLNARAVRRQKNFVRVKSDSTQNESKNVANKQESVQNVSGSTDSSDKKKDDEPPLWNNKKKLEKLRDQINGGNYDEYQEESSLANLPPLEAMWKVDYRIAELEEAES